MSTNERLQQSVIIFSLFCRLIPSFLWTSPNQNTPFSRTEAYECSSPACYNTISES